MKRHSGWSLLVSLLVVLSLVGFAAAQQPRPGGTLRVGYESDVSGLDPHVSPGIQAWHVVGNLFNSLLTIDAELNYVPDLAESWDVLEDGKVYVFHLRKGVKFHDGTAFDAEVVRWNYQRIMDPAEKAFDAPYYSMVETVEVLDAHTITFTLKHPSMTLLPVMAANRAGFLQMSPASYKRWGKEEVRLHVQTGGVSGEGNPHDPAVLRLFLRNAQGYDPQAREHQHTEEEHTHLKSAHHSSSFPPREHGLLSRDQGLMQSGIVGQPRKRLGASRAPSPRRSAGEG